MSDFIPRSDDSLNTWLASFKKAVATYAATLGISADDVTVYQNQCDALIAAILAEDDIKKQLKTVTQTKNDLRSDTLSNLRTLAARIKTEKTYTTAIGNALGIITTDTPIDWSTAKPALTTKLTGGQVIIAFKRGHSNGIKLYSKRGTETAFTFLALDTHSPYHDTRENIVIGTPETRQYYAFYIDSSDVQVGLQSDVVSITV
jgi:hypothetical protein